MDDQPPRRRDVSEAVLRGAPRGLRRDFYFRMMRASWAAFFAGFFLVYVGTNAVFAVLYLLDPGSIANARPGVFLDAFFFSVQTIATIGYGAMAPATLYGHVLVTIEAALGLLGISLVTGLMFARASRPHASILFSRLAVVTIYGGKPTLMFRVGNARGNDVVEANIRIALLRNYQSPEGHRIRRLINLKLERDVTPLFALTWTVMHPIDPDSPLHGLTEHSKANDMASLVVTLTGFDSTFSHTIHARHIYYSEDVRLNHRMVDVLSQRPDGRLEVDYHHFHDVVAEAAPSAPPASIVDTTRA